MGHVHDEVLGRVRRALDARGLVVWFDPEGRYGRVVDALAGEGVPVQRGTAGYFALRRAVEPWLGAETRPRGVVWVPRPEEEGRRALCELCAAAAVLSPTSTAASSNTRLAVVLRAALPPGIAEDVRRELMAMADRPGVTLDEVDALVENAGEGTRAALATVFGSGDVAEIALRFATSPRHDAALAARGLVGTLGAELARLLGEAAPADPADRPEALRERFTRRAFSVVWRARFSDEALDPSVVSRCRLLLDAWRNRLDVRDLYIERARDAEASLCALDARVPTEALAAEPAFARADDALRARVEAAIAKEPSDDAPEAACRAARARFWSQVDPTRMERWSLLETIAQVLHCASSVERALSGAGGDAKVLAQRYAQGDDAWCRLDTAHRHMERRFHALDLDLGGPDAGIERLVKRARQRYGAVTSALTERWVRAFSRAPADTGMARQRETFSRFVRPLLDEGRVAYVLVDGMRFEMARELAASLHDLGEGELRCTLGALPSVTEIGMASLLPGAEEGTSLGVGRDGRLGLVVRSKLLRNRKERVAYLQGEVPGTVVLKLGDVVPLKRAAREEIAAARLVVVTITDELDGLGDGVNPEMARRLMDDVLPQIRRAVRTLSQLGVRVAVITADHGHLFGDALGSDDALPAPGGETVALHRRAWVGRGGSGDASFVRFGAAQLGYEGDLEVAVPAGTGCFTASGAMGGYFHGGASLQEIVVPVLTMRLTSGAVAQGGSVAWSLAASRPKLSAMMVSFVVGGEPSGLFTETERRVRLELRDGRRVISTTWQAAYGLDAASGHVAMTYDPASRAFVANAVTLRLDEAPRGKRVRAVLIDAQTEQELAHTELDVALGGY